MNVTRAGDACTLANGKVRHMPLSLFQKNTFDDIDVQAFRDNSRQLDEFMSGDFSSMADELTKAFPNAPSLPERYVLFAQRVAEEIATLYDQPPRREFAGVNRAQRDKLEEIYAASKFDEELKRLQMRLVLQQTMIAQVLPTNSSRKYRLQHYAPHEFEVEPAQGAAWKDLDAAPEVQLLWPIRTIDERVWYGALTLTRSTATITGGTKPVGLYPGFGGVNPYGRIPLSVLRTVEPRRGRFCGPIAEDVLALNIALNLGASDRESMLHHQAWGQKVLTTAAGEMVPSKAMVENIPVGHDRMMVLPSAGMDYKIVQGDPKVHAYIASDEHAIKTAATMRDMSPSRFSKANTAQTGAARQADAADREQARKRYAKIFEAFERELLATIGETTRIFGDAVPIPETARLESIHYHAWQPPVDPQAQVQANQATDATGETSPVTRVALKHNIPRDAAIDLMQQHIAEQSEINPSPTMQESTDERDDPGNDAGPDTDTGSQPATAAA